MATPGLDVLRRCGERLWKSAEKLAKEQRVTARKSNGTAPECSELMRMGTDKMGMAMELNGMTKMCIGCANSRRNNRDSVYCVLFGIIIGSMHSGCKYYQGGADDQQVRKPEGGN